MHSPRVYVDTSVFGGINDEEFAEPSQRFFERAKRGDFVILISQIVLDELQGAPESILKAVDDLPPEYLERVGVNEEVISLAESYIQAGILGEDWIDDAMHVAAATVMKADLILSWNFKHIVNFRRIQKFNSVNLANGYNLVDIRSPQEVEYGDEDQGF
jgi:hypothetical protein